MKQKDIIFELTQIYDQHPCYAEPEDDVWEILNQIKDLIKKIQKRK